MGGKISYHYCRGRSELRPLDALKSTAPRRVHEGPEPPRVTPLVHGTKGEKTGNDAEETTERDGRRPHHRDPSTTMRVTGVETGSRDS